MGIIATLAKRGDIMNNETRKLEIIIEELERENVSLRLEIGKLRIELEIIKLEIENPDLAKMRKLRDEKS